MCDFESSSSCGWQDVSTSSYQWVPLQANISTWGMEPPFDHSLGTDLGNRLSGDDVWERVANTSVMHLHVYIF